MNFYKKIIRNPETRYKLLDFLECIPDSTMVKGQYRIKTGNKLNLKNPKRYTEKVQWYKLNYHDPLITRCSDKYTVRSYVESKGLSDYLNELYAVYDCVEDIDFKNLPSSFAIKMTTGSGTNIFVSDKSKMDENSIRMQLKEWMDRSKKSYGREWGYYNCTRRIIVEKLIEKDVNNDLPDYKFFCFNGKVHCLYTMIDYTDNHENGKLGFYDKNFNLLPFRRADYGEINREIPKPINFEKMVEVAEILSEGIPHVRVDFYNVGGKIIFGEMTFYNASGYTKFIPDEYDFVLGDQFILPEKK
ncbi:ATP-grasp fold amidoligase family protein [Peribacillus frigoritolerans]|uniref:ATP-grasp fold amidoligase family protein n=1 Tax=Peribacillus frigoritolerans TaxID=450367 RepID=UPI0020C0409B|nr:ATP-grasp fold amidoligase family protein [Peribacillus frigoritolerans]